MGYIKLLFELYRFKNNVNKTNSEITKLQKEKLNNILEYAYDNSTYYKKTFEKVGIQREEIRNLPISAFPTINKKEFIKNFDDIITVKDINQEDLRKFDKEEKENKKILKDKYHIVHSSGSTEKPTYFMYDKKAWNQMLVGIIRAALWDMNMKEILKLLIEQPKIAYLAATDGRYGGAMAVGDGIDKLHAKQIFLDIKTPLEEWVKSINEFNPNMIIGYPSAIKILAELIENNEIDIKAKRVISCGEPLGSNLRQYFEKTFNTEVINFYGASESIALGVESSVSDGMYLFDDMNYIEIENNSMYLTCLYNFSQPIIRYKISDELVLKKEDDKNPFTKVESIVGRNEDLMWFKDEKGHKEFLHPLAIEGFCIEGMRDYQFIKIDDNSFGMIIESLDTNKQDSIKQEMSIQLNKILLEKNLKYVKFSIRFVDNILPNSKTGKKQLIIK